jgi:hypothetical protein
MGQWGCVPMIVAGVALWLWGRGRAAGAAAARARAPRRLADGAPGLPRHRDDGLSPESGDRIIEIGCVESSTGA